MLLECHVEWSLPCRNLPIRLLGPLLGFGASGAISADMVCGSQAHTHRSRGGNPNPKPHPTQVPLMLWERGWDQLDLTHRRLRGSLEGNPEPGDRLRFVFVFVSCVPCVRAGEAKLRVRARCRVFLLGRPRLWQVVVRSRPLCEAQDVVYTWVLRPNGSKSVPRDAH